MAIIGIDIGGTKTGVALTEGREIVWQTTVPTTSFDDTVGAAIAELKARNAPVQAVGIGSAGPLDTERGLVLNDDTLHGWYEKDVVAPFREAFGVPTILLNDADAALLGEIAKGALMGRAEQPAAMLTFGTGVGGAAWTGRELWVGAYHEHSELGHFPVVPNGPQCYCGARGCLESVASGTALNKLVSQLGLASIEQMLDSQRPDVMEAVAQVKQAIETGIWVLAHTIRPAAVVFGGGIMGAFFDRFAPPDGLACKNATMLSRPVEVLRAKLGNTAGVVGAAYAAGGMR